VALADIGDPSVVFYLCAAPFVPASWEDPNATTDANVTTLAEFLAQNKAAAPFRLVYASSGEVYGEVSRGRASETWPLPSADSQRLSPYAQSRIMAEAVLFEWCRKHGIPATILRLFNVIGPRATQAYFVPEMISQITHSESIRHGNLNSVRDFVWIEDTTRAMVAASRMSLDGPLALNVASGVEWSMEEVLSELQRIARSKDLPRVLDPGRLRHVDLQRLVGDPTLAATLLGWRPQVTVSEALERTRAAYLSAGSWPYEERARRRLAVVGAL
jgi:nucleoside-diphosphate-sugar epimerase